MKGILSELAGALVVLRDEFGLEAVTASQRVPDGHVLTLTWAGDGLLTLERDDGWLMVLDAERVLG